MREVRLKIFLSDEQEKALEKAVEKHKTWQKQTGRVVDWDIETELIVAAQRRIEELTDKERANADVE